MVISELEEKLNHFYTSLQRSGYGCGPQKLKSAYRFLYNWSFQTTVQSVPAPP